MTNDQMQQETRHFVGGLSFCFCHIALGCPVHSQISLVQHFTPHKCILNIFWMALVVFLSTAFSLSVTLKSHLHLNIFKLVRSHSVTTHREPVAFSVEAFRKISGYAQLYLRRIFPGQ